MSEATETKKHWEDWVDSGKPLPQYLADIETEIMAKALHDHAHNRTRAADDLGIKRTCLVEKMRKRGWLNRPENASSYVPGRPKASAQVEGSRS